MIHSAEGVTQGDPLGMIFYCFGQLRALRELQTKYPKATVFAYADDVFLFFFGDDYPHAEELLDYWSKVAIRKGGTKVNVQKCAIHRCSRGQANGSAWPAPPPAARDAPPHVNGFVAMGVPVGTDEFVEE